MNFSVLLVILVCVSFTSIAGEYGKYDTREEAIEAHKKSVEKVGGLIIRPASGPSVLFVNEQTKLSDTLAKRQISDVTKKLRVQNIVMTTSPMSKPSALVTNYVEDQEISAVLVLCDVADYPALSVFPELNAAVINVSPLYSDDEALFSERVRKELLRGFGFVFGGGYTLVYPKAALRPIGSSLRELDRLDCVSLSIDSMQSINKVMESWGMVPVKKTSYKRACEEGWAPAPTNEVQKAIWDAVKASAATNAPAAR